MTPPKYLGIALILFVASFGYFVDVYDMWVFAAVRVASLKALGVPADQLLGKGMLLLNLQMTGMLIGGILFGLAGDRYGRTRVMFLSILTYSLATLANAYAPNLETYAALRFLSGFGLARELGLGTTLISEILPKEKRGLGVGLLVGFGVMGPMAAGVCAQLFDWKTCYLIGGVLGLALLLLRVRVAESPLFNELEKKAARRGGLRLLFQDRERVLRFLGCVTLGLPTWFVMGILVTFSEEILKGAGLPPLAAPVLLIYCNIAMPIGNFATVGISQVFRNRRATMAGFTLLAFACVLTLFLLPRPVGVGDIKIIYMAMAFGVGSWVLMAVISAESFGTNLRATVATTVPNFARASVIPMTLGLELLKTIMPLPAAVLTLAFICFALPLGALIYLKETFGRPLEYLEE
ncbi:MAG: MFS transporter [Proteobacteria bacterium]|nr:MFS transporter [Pseudomonadota bacterium]